MPPITISFPYLAFVALSLVICATNASGYDPLLIEKTPDPEVLDLVVQGKAGIRNIPLLIYLPRATRMNPLVLFSHGLGGSRMGNAYLVRHWAARGYVVVFVQHPGSDDEIWKHKPVNERLSALKAAAGPMNFLLRINDVSRVLTRLDLWQTTEGHALNNRLDLSRVGMSGHSFGALTTQAVSGQATARGQPRFVDDRIKAAVALSPGSPQRGKPEEVFGQVKVPWLLMTGTRDIAAIGAADLESRLAVFPALPPGGKYELVLRDAEHSAFTDRILPASATPRNPNHHRVILALSTAFWDSWLNNDPAAKQWLDGNGPDSVIQADDRWQRK